MTFNRFPDLPPELQTQVWEACTAGPCMHIFDVCFPSRPSGRVEKAFGRLSDGEGDVRDQQRFEQFKETVFLDCLENGTKKDDAMASQYPFDPSMYRYANTLRHTSRAAAWTTNAMSSKDGATTVCLPGRGAKLAVPSTDVLMLQFRDVAHVAADPEREVFQSCIGPLLRCQWSAELAATLQAARKVALDAVEGWVFSPHDTLGWDEITHLASTLHKDLEVLYLVDNCAGRCGECGRGDIKAGGLQTRGSLWKRLEGDADGSPDVDRPGDVIRAVGMRYTEVFDLETLGWHECHPTYGFAFLMSNAIRLHQYHGGQSAFKGIRVLVAEEEEGV
ncbi:hypothetical protein G7Z17_g3343 [Cylindrodendrum hubeiense]|uniref:Uncharacterized protein n=1 Tax=Cylindrodendrum hubeiense TaxID=595255 RepID=A0A9P5HI30_9HYPO|nr:hypothetical protein G7Z17_g3343 [Cylindrodendrum hubeiense]